MQTHDYQDAAGGAAGPWTVDLNADLAEEVTDDVGLLAVVTSANVACGYHAGTEDVMRAAVAEAVRRGVVIGAQVSYADRANFGRVVCDGPGSVLAEQVADQVGTLRRLAAEEGGRVEYLKPHGALYHRAATDPDHAEAVLAGSGQLPVLGMPGALLLELAVDQGREVRHEGFPDRGYTADGRLVSRDQPGALVTDEAQIAERAVALARHVDSVCLHGDSPNAVEHARAVRRALEAAGCAVASCWEAT